MHCCKLTHFKCRFFLDKTSRDPFFYRKSSGILSAYRFRQQDHKPLPHLNSIVFNEQNSPVFIVSERPTIYFMCSVARLFNTVELTNETWLNDGIVQYMVHFAQNIELKLSLNWFLRHEIILILDFLRSSAALTSIEESLQLNLAYKLLLCLTENQINDILYIFSHFIFKIDMYSHNMNLSSEEMSQMKSTYGKICVEYYLNAVGSQVNHIRNRNLFFSMNNLFYCIFREKRFEKTMNEYQCFQMTGPVCCF